MSNPLAKIVNLLKPKRQWAQFSLGSLLFLVVIVASACWWLMPKRLDRAYFPVRVGDQWVYESDEGDVVFDVVGLEPVADMDCFVVERTFGGEKLRFYLSVAADGVRICRVGDDLYDPPYRKFAFGTRQGNTWDWKGTSGSQEGE